MPSPTKGTEVASAEFDFHIVQVIVDPENIASRRVAVRNAFKDMGERDGKILYLLELAPAAPEPERREGRGNG